MKDNVSMGQRGETGGGAQAVMRIKLHWLASCCVVWFLTGHGLVLVDSPGVGDPGSGVTNCPGWPKTEEILR